MFFGVLALGLRLGLLTPAPSLKRARGDRVPKSSRAGDTVCLGKMRKMFVVTRGETPQLTELVQHARSFTWPVVLSNPRFVAQNALTAAVPLHDVSCCATTGTPSAMRRDSFVSTYIQQACFQSMVNEVLASWVVQLYQI